MHRLPRKFCRDGSSALRAVRSGSYTQACTSSQPTRAASTSANPYPYPNTSHPSPHQIFHLPKSATRADVKARYYDLVRIYHPDSPVARAGGVSTETAHARFQAISSAYAILSGKRSAAALDDLDAEGLGGTARASYHDLSTAMWRARQRQRAELDTGLDERWKERMMTGALVVAVALLVLQTYNARTRAMSEVRKQRQQQQSPVRTSTSLALDSADMDSSDARRLAEVPADVHGSS